MEGFKQEKSPKKPSVQEVMAAPVRIPAFMKDALDSGNFDGITQLAEEIKKEIAASVDSSEEKSKTGKTDPLLILRSQVDEGLGHGIHNFLYNDTNITADHIIFANKQFSFLNSNTEATTQRHIRQAIHNLIGNLLTDPELFEKNKVNLGENVRQKINLIQPGFFENETTLTYLDRILKENLLSADVSRLKREVELYAPPAELILNIDKKVADDEQKLMTKLISFVPFLGETFFQQSFPNTFEKVKQLSLDSLDHNLDLADYFIENLDSYYKEPWVAGFMEKAISHYSVASKFEGTVQVDNPTWFDEPWVAGTLEKAHEVIQTHHSFDDIDVEENRHGGQGLSESDPYENHKWHFGPKQIELSAKISKYILGDMEALLELDQELEKAGMDKAIIEKVHYMFAEAEEELNKKYRSFLKNFEENSNISDDDKNSLRNPESVGMTPLLDTVRILVARFLAQKGDIISNLPEYQNVAFDRLIEWGFKKYLSIYQIDIPLYNKLYEEFDGLRETGRYPLEVYLGRDGIYAYIGRRAQDVSRRRKMGLHGRRKLREMGEVIEINPQYTVYPRYFRDNLNYETKRKFLEQEGISPDADPMFYDTGYTGTIPEQIMKIMDFEPDEIEQRIRLLSAPSTHRRVKGISENARNEIIEHIEHNAKSEESAEGLVIDEKTGKIRHIAKPTDPEDQFYFSMVSQAIGRHYWLQEKLHHEPSGNVNLDSEHYAIRIRQEYAALLPQQFLSDPRAFFAEQGELLKGSKGQGPYPDEEITLFTIADGTEIVAKRVELLKAKEARKEFTILIAAKKAGLPTAEPVGFLSGKEEKDGSYLLMKKLEGRSGRKFEKELKDSGKYSAEQIATIMHTVAEKNKEMAELFRTTLKIDKRWRIKDTMIEFNEETMEVSNVIPIDWERAIDYNPNSPKAIDEIVWNG